MADAVLDFPTTKPVTSGGGAGPRAPVDSFTAKIPVQGGLPEQQAEIGVENAEAKQAEIAGAEGVAGIDAAKAAETATGLAAEEAKKYSQAVDQLQASMAPRMQRIAEEHDKATAEAASKKYENHWAEQSTGTKVLAAISSFLGGLATGQPVSRAQEWIDKDHEQQKMQMDRLWEVAKMKGADQDHLNALMESGLRHLEAGYNGRLEAVKREIDHQAAIKGTQQAFTNAAKLKADLEAKRAERIQKAAEDLRVTGMTHTVRQMDKLLPQVQKKRLPDGTIIWRNPANGDWQPLAKLNGPAPPVASAPILDGKYRVAGEAPGMVAPGNIDLGHRPDVKNADGSHSSVRSMSFEENGQEILVPTVPEDGSHIMSDNEAIAQYHRTGKFLGKFKTPADATRYAQRLHEQQAGAMRR